MKAVVVLVVVIGLAVAAALWSLGQALSMRVSKAEHCAGAGGVPVVATGGQIACLDKRALKEMP